MYFVVNGKLTRNYINGAESICRQYVGEVRRKSRLRKKSINQSKKLY